MKKSQRLRLAALLAKDQAKLTAAEKAELATLSALAATHTDASQDVDDSKKISIAEFFARLTGASAANAQLTTELAAEKAKVADLTAKLADKGTAPVVSDADKAAALNAKTEADSKILTLGGILGAIGSAFGLKAEEIAALTPATAQAAANARIDAVATDKLASLGFPLSGLPPAAAAGAVLDEGKEMTHEAFSKLSPHGKKKFCLGGGKITALLVTGPFADIAGSMRN